jgi:hypothetical protein
MSASELEEYVHGLARAEAGEKTYKELRKSEEDSSRREGAQGASKNLAR